MENLPVPLDRRVWLEATALSRAGYTVSVICPKGGEFQASEETIDGVRVHRYWSAWQGEGALGFAFEFTWSFLLILWKSILVAGRGAGFDVIHACNPPDTLWLLGVLWRPFGKRFVFDHHDLSPELYRAKFGGKRGFVYRSLVFLERLSFRWADAILSPNESHRRVAVRRGGVPPERVYVVRNGPDLDRFSVCPPDASLKAKGGHLLVYLGEMCRQDGVDHLVRALKLLRDEFRRDDVHCVFVGGGPHQPALRAYAGAVGVSDLCTFTGRVSDAELCRFLSSADLAIDPDPKNAWSDRSTMTKVAEYMYFGLPIVCFDLQETRFTARDAAVYARPNDDRELAREIAGLLDLPEKRRAMSRFGAQRAREALAWKFSVPNLLGAYERVCAAPGRADRLERQHREAESEG